MSHVLVQLDNRIVHGLAEQVDEVAVAGGGEAQAERLCVFAKGPHAVAKGHDRGCLPFRLLVQGDLHGHAGGHDAHLEGSGRGVLNVLEAVQLGVRTFIHSLPRSTDITAAASFWAGKQRQIAVKVRAAMRGCRSRPVVRGVILARGDFCGIRH